MEKAKIILRIINNYYYLTISTYLTITNYYLKRNMLKLNNYVQWGKAIHESTQEAIHAKIIARMTMQIIKNL